MQKKSNGIVKPFKTYNGGKAGAGTYQTIINHIPECSCFIDAFVGNGGIVTNLRLPAVTVINDIDPGLIDKYDFVGHGTFIKESMDYKAVIAKYDDGRSSTLFYFDVPYLKSSRKTQKDLYKFDWTLTDHQAFLLQVRTVKSRCMYLIILANFTTRL